MTNQLEDFLVFDLETQRDFQSVGGRSFMDRLKMSVGVVFDSKQNKFFTYFENDVNKLIAHLTSGPLIVGFNHIGFDFEVLAGYRQAGDKQDFINHVLACPNFDIILNIKDHLGHFVSLNSLVSATLHKSKTADGRQALDWYQEYSKTNDHKYLEQIATYCTQDVAVTRDLYIHGCFNGRIFHETKLGELKWIDVDWKGKRTNVIIKSVEKIQPQLF